MKFLRSILIIARNELGDSLRSRRTAVLLLLHVAGALAATFLFVKTLQKVEAQISETLGVQAVKEAGSVTGALRKSESFRHILIRLAGDKELAERLLAIPPLALFYGWLAFTFAPLLTVLTAGPRMAEEVQSGSVRFVLFRASRTDWCIGKLLGQALQLLAGLLLSAVGAWCIGRWSMASFEPLAAAQAMLLFVWKAWVYTIPYLGLASAISLLCRSPNLAMALSLMALTVVSAFSRAASYFAGDGQGWRRILDLAYQVTPSAHLTALWRFDAAHWVPAIAYLFAVGAAYFLIGVTVFRRKDL